MDSMVALYWLSNHAKPWKTFVTNRVKKIAAITNEIGLVWKYCASSENLADLGSRGATIEKMVKDVWFTGPEWLLHVEHWPKQPQLKGTTHVSKRAIPAWWRSFLPKNESLMNGMRWWEEVHIGAH
jgi:hypothetical protein